MKNFIFKYFQIVETFLSFINIIYIKIEDLIKDLEYSYLFFTKFQFSY